MAEDEFQGIETSNKMEGRMVNVRWSIPDTLPTRFATNMLIQSNEHEYILSFFEVRPPLISGSEDEHIAAIEAMGGLPAQCVARVAIATTRMHTFIRAFAQTLPEGMTLEGILKDAEVGGTSTND